MTELQNRCHRIKESQRILIDNMEVRDTIEAVTLKINFFFFFLLLHTSTGVAKMAHPDIQYKSYRQFSHFVLEVQPSSSSLENELQLSSTIIESTMHPSNHGSSNEKNEATSVKKFYHKVELFFDSDRKPAIQKEQPLYESPGSQAMASNSVHDGRIIDSLQIKFSKMDLALFVARDPKKVTVIFYDEKGAVVTKADVRFK